MDCDIGKNQPISINLTKMSGEDELNKYDDPKLKGLSRYFNSTTIRGRANVTIATYAVIIGYFLYAKLIKSKSSECPPSTSVEK
ncbi:hypothetical protein HUJ04_007079 [Dendroctonus ponderosae]|nr:hypothetical protein HUJ04_007079 [Dendroctonus ponderosae]KAH1025019.1 hypothetical protein HUJ05_009832 [Dendroctonus ponderosae]